MKDPNEHISIGRLGRPYGVRGWVHVNSFTDPEEKLLEYSECLLKHPNGKSQSCTIESIKPHGKHFVAKIDCLKTREEIPLWTNAILTITRSQLPILDEGEFYLTDIVGFQVLDQANAELGILSEILPTGANDVLVVTMPSGKQTAIPYIPSVIMTIDHDKKRILVDWEPL